MLMKNTETLVHPLNPTLEGLGISDTLAINEKSKALMAQGKMVYRFGLGQSPFPVPDVIVEALRLHAPQKDYLPVQGLQALREAVAGFHSRKDLLNIKPDNIIVGPGSKELLFLLQIAFNGEVLIPSPSWVSYLPQAKILDKSIGIIHASYKNKWLITAEDLEKHLQKSNGPQLLILNYPGNPDGMSYSEEQLKEIAAVARRYNLFILSDEIYGQLNHSGNHISIARFYPEGTIVSSGLSKWCGAGGWRLGTFSFPDELSYLMKAMCIIASESYSSVSAPIQYAAIQAFRGGNEIEEYLFLSRKILQALGKKCASLMREAGINVYDPVGGFYLFPDFTPLSEHLAKRNISNAYQLCSRLLEETGVAILPGPAFNRPKSELTARIAYVDFDGAAVLQSAKAIPFSTPFSDAQIDAWCNKTIDGIKRLCDWIK